MGSTVSTSFSNSLPLEVSQQLTKGIADFLGGIASNREALRGSDPVTPQRLVSLRSINEPSSKSQSTLSLNTDKLVGINSAPEKDIPVTLALSRSSSPVVNSRNQNTSSRGPNSSSDKINTGQIITSTKNNDVKLSTGNNLELHDNTRLKPELTIHSRTQISTDLNTDIKTNTTTEKVKLSHNKFDLVNLNNKQSLDQQVVLNAAQRSTFRGSSTLFSPSALSNQVVNGDSLLRLRINDKFVKGEGFEGIDIQKSSIGLHKDSKIKKNGGSEKLEELGMQESGREQVAKKMIKEGKIEDKKIDGSIALRDTRDQKQNRDNQSENEEDKKSKNKKTGKIDISTLTKNEYIDMSDSKLDKIIKESKLVNEVIAEWLNALNNKSTAQTMDFANKAVEAFGKLDQKVIDVGLGSMLPQVHRNLTEILTLKENERKSLEKIIPEKLEIQEAIGDIASGGKMPISFDMIPEMDPIVTVENGEKVHISRWFRATDDLAIMAASGVARPPDYTLVTGKDDAESKHIELRYNALTAQYNFNNGLKQQIIQGSIKNAEQLLETMFGLFNSLINSKVS